MSPEQITKNQHYVPQFYLHNFVNSEGEVEILDGKLRKVTKPRGTSGICCEDFYYGIRTGKHDEISQLIEDGFKQMETNISKNLGLIITKILRNEQMYDHEKWLVSLLMSLIWIRGPVMRGQINRMQEDMFKKVLSFSASHPNSDTWFDRFDRETGTVTTEDMRKKLKETMLNEEYNLEFCNQQHLMMFEDVSKYANLFCAQDWAVLISKSARNFITSDNPVVVVVPERKSFYGPGFLERNHYFTLTPQVAIRTRYAKRTSLEFPKIHRKTLFDNADKEIHEYNMIIADRSFQYIYSNEKKDLEYVLMEAGRRQELLTKAQNDLIRTTMNLRKFQEKNR